MTIFAPLEVSWELSDTQELFRGLQRAPQGSLSPPPASPSQKAKRLIIPEIGNPFQPYSGKASGPAGSGFPDRKIAHVGVP